MDLIKFVPVWVVFFCPIAATDCAGMQHGFLSDKSFSYY